MDNTLNSQDTASFRFTSIEPVQVVQDRVREIATQYGLDLQIQSEQTFNAPFCGIDYYTQEMTVFVPNQPDAQAELASCIKDVASLQDTHLADGFFEVIG